MIIEICANSYESALNAQNAGADRIELCAELAVGGITPSYGLLKKVKEDIFIPVHVLVRPRSGNFTYSAEEVELMKQDILLCKELGFQGIVSGVLKEDHTVDPDRTRALIELARPLSFTFHRAFDWVPKPLEAVDILRNLGVDRILSSGQEKTALEGLEVLKAIREKAAAALIIMPGGGINEENIIRFKNEGFKELHFSALSLTQKSIRVKVGMNAPALLGDDLYSVSDFQCIKRMIRLVK